MKRSNDRILTTHVGSLPRPQPIIDALIERRASGPEFDVLVRRAVADSVREQVASGIDIPSDGEMSKTGFSPYVDERMSGFEPAPTDRFRALVGRDRTAFADFYKILDAGASVGRMFKAMACTAPIKWTGDAILKRDLENFKSALDGQPAVEGFVPSVAPGTVASQRRNLHYKTAEEYLFAVADALAPEYKAIVDAGFILQIDDPRMVTEFDSQEPEPTIAEYQRFAGVRIDAINHAIKGLPADRIRYHVCWGSWPGPHSTDIALKHLLPLLLRLKVGGFSIEAANPQHAHEWELFETERLPDGLVLIPGSSRTRRITSSIRSTSPSGSCSTRAASGART